MNSGRIYRKLQDENKFLIAGSQKEITNAAQLAEEYENSKGPFEDYKEYAESRFLVSRVA